MTAKGGNPVRVAGKFGLAAILPDGDELVFEYNRI